MAEIRGIDVIASKWATVTPQRVGDYESGVRAPVRDWAKATQAANDAWKAGIQAAIAGDAFNKGVGRAGTGTWQAGAVEKGTQRWGPGVQLGQDAYATGFAPFVEAIRRVTLPARFARRDPRNMQRVNAIVNAMIDTAKRQG